VTAPHYGKRRAGLLTAASPGDTLHFNFGAYNDSGDSELLTGFAVTDIEVFKDGNATARATDSGYSLISDTGMIGNRVGLYRFSVSLFNTADDATFYAAGSWYQVAVDAVSIDGKTVRMWVGSFEIGEPRANVIQIDGDTGPADNLGRIAGDTGTGSYIYRESDTGGIADAIWAKDIRTLTAFLFDTGIAQTVWRSSTSGFTSDTGSVGYAQGRIMAVRNDTGAAHLDQGRFGVISDSGRQAAVLDTGKVAAAIWTSHATRALTAFAFDTGIWGSNFASGRTLTSFLFDTGVADTVWKYTDTGARRVNAKQISGDTGAAIHLAQAFAAQNTNSDTGLIANAAAIRTKTDSLTFTVAGSVDSNVQLVNDVTVTGAGTAGNPWGP
jgi:hypothetical protein